MVNLILMNSLTNNKRFMEKNYNSPFYNNNKFNNRYSSADKNYN